jgi:hypothetical protein
VIVTGEIRRALTPTKTKEKDTSQTMTRLEVARALTPALENPTKTPKTKNIYTQKYTQTQKRNGGKKYFEVLS